MHGTDPVSRDDWPFPAMLPFQIIYGYPLPPLLDEIAPPLPSAWPGAPKASLQKWRGELSHLESNGHQIYVHIPFCPFVCDFCPFYKITPARSKAADVRQGFVDSLLREIELVGQVPAAQHPYTVVYFGGGTPTELTPAQLTQILDALRANFDIVPNAEITLEAVARQLLKPGYFEEARAAGFNRVSFGVQSLDLDVRKAIGRTGDDPGDYPRAIEHLRAIDPDLPINVEFMAGCPGQSTDQLEADLRAALAWDPASIDVFNYTMVPGTRLHQHVVKGRRAEPRYGATLLQMRQLTRELLGGSGYRQVAGEVYAKADTDRFIDSFLGKGNALNTTLALGPSAIGLVDGTVYRNACRIEDYQAAIEQGRLPVDRQKQLDATSAWRRALLFNIAALAIPEALVVGSKTRKAFTRWEEQGLLARDPDGYRLTDKGALWYNHMQLELLPLRDMVAMLSMMGTFDEQLAVLDRGGELGDEYLAMAGSRVGSLGALGYRGYVRARSLIPGLDRPALGWLGTVDPPRRSR